MKRAGVDIVRPLVTVPHLVDWLMECGPCELAGMDRAPIGWMTIKAWSEITGVRPRPWEARLLRRLSAEWLAENRRAEKFGCPAPTADAEAKQSQRKLVERKLAAMFG